MDKFVLHSEFAPTGNQPQAIEQLVQGFKEGNQFQTLLSVTGSVKTFIMANVIEQLNKPTFNNGIDLRNMYLHGSQPNSPEDEKIHMSNYWIILKLPILCILKISDDVETSAYVKKVTKI